MIKKNKIPTILGIAILLVGTFAGVFFLGMNQFFRVGADTSVTPKDIRVSNIGDTSATISWTTDKETSDFLIWGGSQISVNQVEKESDTLDKFFSHSITLSGLKANTTYFYKINSEGVTFDNKGIPWQFTTGAALSIGKAIIVVSGSVVTAAGDPEKRALVYANVNGYLLSTLTSDTGTYVLQLGSVRSQDLQSYQDIDPAQTLIEISVQAGQDGTASAQIFPQSANPVPPLILGKVYDFRNLQPQASGQIPNANLSLPENATKASKFIIPTVTGTPTPTSVILESLKDGEVVTSTKPAFFGRGPAGESITITIQSNPITQTMQIAKDGTWTFSPSVNLDAGAHTITISWVDSTGITRTITRNFVVQASELPSFVATPSQTLSPTVKPSSTPAGTPTPSPSGTPVPVPITGDLTPTLMLFIMGIVILTFSVAIWKFAEAV